MAQENVEIVRAYFAAFDRRDLREAADFLHEDVEWTNLALIDEERIGGRAAVLAYWERLFAAFPFEHADHEFIPAGGRVCVLATVSAKGPKSGVQPPPIHAGYALTLRDGQITHSDFFPTRAEALKAAGVAE